LRLGSGFGVEARDRKISIKIILAMWAMGRDIPPFPEGEVLAVAFDGILKSQLLMPLNV